MQSTVSLIFVVLIIIMTSACNHEAPKVNPIIASKSFDSQLEAALAITNPIQRDEALYNVAQSSG